VGTRAVAVLEGLAEAIPAVVELVEAGRFSEF
jgi:hypothetical protein